MFFLVFYLFFDDTPAKKFEDQRLQQLLGLKRVYVDKLAGGMPSRSAKCS